MENSKQRLLVLDVKAMKGEVWPGQMQEGQRREL